MGETKIRDLPKVGWIKHTAFHWQARVHGEILDYWPTKVKWRFRGETRSGHFRDLRHHRAVREFIANVQPNATGVCRDCKHWVRGIGKPNSEDAFGECTLLSTGLGPDQVSFKAEEDTCKHWEPVSP